MYKGKQFTYEIDKQNNALIISTYYNRVLTIELTDLNGVVLKDGINISNNIEDIKSIPVKIELICPHPLGGSICKDYAYGEFSEISFFLSFLKDFFSSKHAKTFETPNVGNSIFCLRKKSNGLYFSFYVEEEEILDFVEKEEILRLEDAFKTFYKYILYLLNRKLIALKNNAPKKVHKSDGNINFLEITTQSDNPLFKSNTLYLKKGLYISIQAKIDGKFFQEKGKIEDIYEDYIRFEIRKNNNVKYKKIQIKDILNVKIINLLFDKSNRPSYTTLNLPLGQIYTNFIVSYMDYSNEIISDFKTKSLTFLERKYTDIIIFNIFDNFVVIMSSKEDIDKLRKRIKEEVIPMLKKKVAS